MIFKCLLWDSEITVETAAQSVFSSSSYLRCIWWQIGLALSDFRYMNKSSLGDFQGKKGTTFSKCKDRELKFHLRGFQLFPAEKGLEPVWMHQFHLQLLNFCHTQIFWLNKLMTLKKVVKQKCYFQKYICP